MYSALRWIQFGGPLLIAGIGEFVRERGASVGLYLTALGLLIFALAGFQQLRQRLSFRGSDLGFDAYFRWKSGTAGTALIPEAPSPATPARTPTMIARPYGLSHPPDITVEITGHEWTRTRSGTCFPRLPSPACHPMWNVAPWHMVNLPRGPRTSEHS